MREDFEEHLLPWAAQFPERLRLIDFTWDRFRVAASWVASRAFGVDGWHGAGGNHAAKSCTPIWPRVRRTLTCIGQVSTPNS